MVNYEEKARPSAVFFSVKHSCIIGGTRFRPSICYKIPDSLASTIAGLAETGFAKLYEKEMRFVSGVAMAVKDK